MYVAINDSKSDNPKPAYRTKLGAIKNKLSGLVSSDTWQMPTKGLQSGILLTPMYEQFSSGTHFWKHNHHNPLVFSSQKCDVFILLSDFTFLFGMVDAYLSGSIPPFLPSDSAPTLKCSRMVSSVSAAPAPIPIKVPRLSTRASQGTWSIPPKRQGKILHPKKQKWLWMIQILKLPSFLGFESH